MDRDTTRLRRLLLDAGLNRTAVDAAWPSWWSGEAADTPRGRSELRRALATKLGLSDQALAGNRVEFIWRDEARFKHLESEDSFELAAITSFGTAIGRTLLAATSAPARLSGVLAADLRRGVLKTGPWVDLSGLLGAAWGLGVPVVHLRVFPVTAKRMHAMVVVHDERCAILLARDSHYPAPVAFTLAHEIGHIALGHLCEATALIDFEPADSPSRDREENGADQFALEVLTGTPQPQISMTGEPFSASALAKAALEAGATNGVEPGTLALVVGHQREAWPTATAALSYIYDQPREVWREVNEVAVRQLRFDLLPPDDVEYLTRVMGISPL